MNQEGGQGNDQNQAQRAPPPPPPALPQLDANGVPLVQNMENSNIPPPHNTNIPGPAPTGNNGYDIQSIQATAASATPTYNTAYSSLSIQIILHYILHWISPF